MANIAPTYSPNGKYIVSSRNVFFEDNLERVFVMVFVRDALTGTILSRFVSHEGYSVSAITHSPEGRYLLVLGADGKLRVSDVSHLMDRGEITRLIVPDSFHKTGPVNDVMYSPNGKHILCRGDSEKMWIWEIETAKERVHFVGHIGNINSMAYSPNGTRIISGGSDQTIRIWDAETGQELTRLIGHTDQVNAVAYSPDGRRIVSGSSDQTIRLWYGDIEYLLDLADSFIQRDPPVFLGDERTRFGFWEQPAKAH
jgi:WD40 repeat protein